MACGLKQALKEDYLNCGLRVFSNTHSDCFFWDNIITFGLKRLPCLGYKSLQSLIQPTACFLQPPGAHLSLSNQAWVNSLRPFCWACLAAATWAGSSLKNVVQQRVLQTPLQQMCVDAFSSETLLTQRDDERSQPSPFDAAIVSASGPLLRALAAPFLSVWTMYSWFCYNVFQKGGRVPVALRDWRQFKEKMRFLLFICNFVWGSTRAPEPSTFERPYSPQMTAGDLRASGVGHGWCHILIFCLG